MGIARVSFCEIRVAEKKYIVQLSGACFTSYVSVAHL